MTFGLISLPILALALSGAHDDAPRQARAHVHGVGEAFLLQESDTLFLQVVAPAANFATEDAGPLGLEGLQTADLMDQLISPNSAAGCAFTSVEFEIEELEESAEHDHDHHDEDHEHDAHAEHHDHESDEHAEHHAEHHGETHEDDEHHHDHEEDEHAGHSNILMSLDAVCDHPDRLRDVDFTLFETFSGFDSLQTTFVTVNSATATTLTPDTSSISRP
ncbi:DUF2796 domain-containing protein [Ponticaulis sp.]|uniref:ZrgA family zinc uptake protein n=1 Tax=Ponticaulis sp. TaxID=2020902 RepID=UPI000B6E5B9E|nr:DUF2796 domain-containing protein [Ponticaulis sp.]MAI88865.1 hypothetical protein [Ponticaulis sp.]OUY01557.1 MAG: hypothetical protein CBB65_00100 [Hyphomonadaceae bacterium TMED5]|tara:strand:+ start:12475 stop:13131 length:657 start_codon:yes stop_codon:yes gene_type:complete